MTSMNTPPESATNVSRHNPGAGLSSPSRPALIGSHDPEYVGRHRPKAGRPTVAELVARLGGASC
jgi:hypothetical protein